MQDTQGKANRDLAMRAVRRLLSAMVIMAAAFFGAAGTFRWPAAWAYLLLQSTFSGALGAWLYRNNPGLLEQRLQVTKRSALPADKFIMAAGLLLMAPYLVLPGLDAVRYQWSSVPAGVQAASFGAVLASLALLAWVMRENTYLYRFVEVLPGQRVITSGPYAVVRHPLYAALSVYFLAVPLALGSLWCLFPAAGIVLLLIYRTVIEDRTLLRDLAGYAEYARRVRYRLVPGLW